MAADLAQFFGEKLPMSVRARVIERDGDVVAVAGYYFAGSRVAVFSDLKADLPKMTIWREAKALMDGISLPAYCMTNTGAGQFLKRLGWDFHSTSPDGDFYTWQP